MITATNSSTAALAAQSPTTIGASTTNAAGAEDRFLKLLVAQLSNQDPMNPMDNAQMTSQMAQISTVTGVQQVNKAIQDLVAQMASTQMLQSSALVGRNVLVDGTKLPVKDGKAAGAVDLVGAADSVKIDILSTAWWATGSPPPKPASKSRARNWHVTVWTRSAPTTVS